MFLTDTLGTTVPTEIIETTAEVVETIAETLPDVTETIPQVIEVVETIDYTATLEQILGSVQNVEYFLYLMTGFALFFVVVCLCYFCYKFFRIFF